jgi:hypothetical protein
MPKTTSTKPSTKKSTTTKTTTKKISFRKKPITKKELPSTTAQKARLIKKIAQQAEEQQIEQQIKKAIHSPARKNAEGKRTIPIGIRIFFGCSLLLFCIALYKAILLPKIIQHNSDMPTVTTVTNRETNQPPILTDNITTNESITYEPITESQT